MVQVVCVMHCNTIQLLAACPAHGLTRPWKKPQHPPWLAGQPVNEQHARCRGGPQPAMQVAEVLNLSAQSALRQKLASSRTTSAASESVPVDIDEAEALQRMQGELFDAVVEGDEDEVEVLVEAGAK
eukprot:4297468-Prymnesium_polylepis.1